MPSVIAVAGGAIGFLISMVLTSLLRKGPAGFFLPPMKTYDPAIAAACIVVAFAIGLLSCLIGYVVAIWAMTTKPS